MRVTSEGYVEIPRGIRERLGWEPDTEVQLEVEGDSVRIRPVALRPERPARKQTPLIEEPLFGMWRDREDLADSVAWVRRSREQGRARRDERQA